MTVMVASQASDWLAVSEGRGECLPLPLRAEAVEEKTDGPRIAVIEPGDSQRLLYEWELAEDGYEVTSSPNVGELLGRLDPYDTALVLLDGGVNLAIAVERVRRVKRVFPTARLVMHTASYRLASERVSAMSDALLLKSTDLGGLKRTIRSLLRSASPSGRRRVTDSARECVRST